jgi:hypothetical protein
MRMLMLALAAMTTIGLAAPAAAQDVGVRVGPLEFGAGPRYDDGWRYRHHYGDCRVIREHVVTPSGREIYRSHRVCD